MPAGSLHYVRPRMNILRVSLPWKGPLLPPTVHVALAMLWGGVTDGNLTLGAWQLVAWPLLAGCSLVTMSPLLAVIAAHTRSSMKAGTLLALAVALAATSSTAFVLLAHWQFAASVAVSWLLALASAAALECAVSAKEERASRPIGAA